MPPLPTEFEDLLSPAGRRVLAGRHPLCGALADPRRRFLAADDLVKRRAADDLRRALDTALYPHLSVMADPIPPEALWGMTCNYDEWLPKAMRVKTAYLERRRGRAFQAAERIGLVRLMQSAGFRAFAAALAGRPLRAHWGMQVLAYDPGDYAGPHNDHHPEDPRAARGYLDVHLTLSSPGVAQQLLVWAKAGHFTECVDVARRAGITAYRLPFWHYATPLQAKPGHEARARRWVLLGTFLFADQGRPAAGTGN